MSPVDQDNDRNRLKTQLESFYYALLNQGLEGYKMPKSWMEAFFLLEQLLQDQDNGERQVIFIDELPWMDTPRSGFLPAFENFWNGWPRAQFKQKQRKVNMREMNCKWLRMSNIS